MRSYVLAIIGCILSVLFFVGMLVYMSIANDLAEIVTNQKYYIHELEWELEQTEMICSNIEVE